MSPRSFVAVVSLVALCLPAACGGSSSPKPAGDERPAKRKAGGGPGPSRKTERGRAVPDTLTFPKADIKIAELPDDTVPGAPTISAAGPRVAWSTADGVPYLDGAVIEGADGMRDGAFSPNGQYFGYVATVGHSKQPPTIGKGASAEAYVVVGDEQFGPHERLELLAVDDDGTVQYVAGRSGNRVVYVDDAPGPVFQRIDRIDLVRKHRGGRVVAYRAVGEDQQCVVVGDKPDCHALVGRPVLSPDGKHVAYTAAKDIGVMSVVVDGKRLDATHTFVDWRIALADSGAVAYVAQTGETGRQVSIGGTLGPLYDRIVHLTLGRGGEHVAYAARKDSKWRLVTGTTAHPPVDGEITEVVLGSTPEAWAIVVRNDDGTRVVTPAGSEPLHRGVAWLTLSDDGKTLGYVAKTEQGAVVNVGDHVSPPADEAGDIRLFEGGGWAYLARRGEAWTHSTPPCSEPGSPPDPFSVPPAKIIAGAPEHNYAARPDGSDLAFTARTGAQWRVVVAGTEGPLHDDVWATSLTFDPQGARVGYLARSGRELWWRMQPLPTP